VGTGGFGKVYLVRCKKDGKIYAMKAIRKDIILDADMLHSTELEK
jgi:serine/threonine protein kinase